MKRSVVLILLALVSVYAWGMDRKTGNPRSKYIEKGTMSVSLSGGYYHVGAGALSELTSNYSLYGLVNNIKGGADVYDVNAAFSWFFANNFSLAVRAGYSGLNADLESASILGMMNFDNKHITRPMLNASIGVRGYLPLFNSKVFALFCEGRVTGATGSVKSYSNTERGKEGTFNDVNQVLIGLYPGMSFFVTDNIAVEISLPLIEGGYKWETQYEGQDSSAQSNNGLFYFKPNILKLNFGVVFHF